MSDKPRSADADEPREVVKKTAIQEVTKKAIGLAPYLSDLVPIVFEIFGHRKLSKQIKDMVAEMKGGQQQAAAPVPTASSVDPKTSPTHDIAGAPLGLTKISHQDEARKKRLWDRTLRYFRDLDPPQPELPMQFSKIAQSVFEKDEKQEMLRDIITRDPDDRKAVEGCVEMIYACQTEEDFRAYMYEIGVLHNATDGENARKAATQNYHATVDRIRQSELTRRRALGIDKVNKQIS